VVDAPAATPVYAPMEPMSPTPAPPCYWCDFCKEFTLMPHTLEYNYSLSSPTPVPETQVAAGRSIPSDYFEPWYFNTVAAPMLNAVKPKDEIGVVAYA